MKKLAFHLLVVGFLCSCQITNLHDARPLRKGEKSLAIHTNSTLAEDLGNANVAFTNQILPLTPIYPGIEYSWGTRFRTHWTLGLSTTRGLYGGTNIGILTDPEKKVALSVYPQGGLSTQGGMLGFLHLPLLVSFYPSERVSFTLSPAALLTKPFDASTSWRNFGTGSVNVLYGRKNKVGISLGMMGINGQTVGQCSLGYAFRFGRK